MAKLFSPRPPTPGDFAVGGASIKLMSKFRIAPATATPQMWLSLSNLDRITYPSFSSVILFYRNILNMHLSFLDVSSSLRKSLAEVLIEFFPLAGRLAVKKDGLVDLHCNDEGALFFEASVKANLSALGGAQPMPELSGLKFARLGRGPTYIPDQTQSMPVLVIMVTKFDCGSIAIAANWHHTIADGLSGRHFMQSWAEVASGKSMSVIPNHDRFLLQARSPPDVSSMMMHINGNVELVMDVADRARQDRNYRYRESSDCLHSEPAVLTSLNMTKDSIQKIEQNIISGSESPETNDFTSAECISAHLWWQMTRLRAEESMNDENTNLLSMSTRFFMFVDGRRRLNLPAGYFGNVMCSASSIATEEEILTKPLAYAASLLRQATQSITEEYFRSLIDWVEMQGTSSCELEHMVYPTANDTGATIVCTFLPSYDMDFGWGKPELAARNSPPQPLIVGIALMPSREESMVAHWNLHPDLMHRLRSQDSFKAVFS